jgi:FKBP-type peptidyl-prolyl cis-trans isomerase FkpA
VHLPLPRAAAALAAFAALAAASLPACKSDPAKVRAAEEREEREEERARQTKEARAFREQAKGKLGPADAQALYALGALLGTRAAPYAFGEAELSLVEQGFGDAVRARKLDLPDPNLDEWGPKVEAMLQRRAVPALGAEVEKGKKAIEAELLLPGAQKLPSGVVVRMLKSGSGQSPTEQSTVRVKYQGKLVSGEEFDASPGVEFPLGQVIQCWREGVPKLQPGGSARLLCPPQTAYGDQGQPPRIPGGATLVFEVELLAVAAK